jgi:hypothetical protein
MLAAPEGLACRRECTLRTQATTGQPEQPAFPAQWFYGLYVISSVRRAFWPPSPSRTSCEKLDPSVGQGNRIWIWKAIALICKKDSEDGSRITEIVGWANS